MTEGRHHRRHDDDHTADGIYVPPPREVPHPRSRPPEPADRPPAAAPSPWAPAAPGGPPPVDPAPQHARSPEWTARLSPWAPVDDDEYDDGYSDEYPEEYDEEDPYAAEENVAPAPPPRADTRPRYEPPRQSWAADEPGLTLRMGPRREPPRYEPPAREWTEEEPPPRYEPPAEERANAKEEWLPPLYPQEWPPEPRREEWPPEPRREEWTPEPRREEWTPEPRREEWTPEPRREEWTPPPTERRPTVAPAGPPPERRSSATSWWIAIGVIIVALAVAAGVLVGLSLAARGGSAGQPAGAAGASCGGREVLRATVAPELAPAVEQAAADIGANQIGGCKLVAVTAQQAYQGGEAWIPATAAWAQVARFTYAPEPVSLARSPVVVAAPRPFAEGLGWPGAQPTWAALAAGVNGGQVPRLSMSSPLHDTAGLLAALEVHSAMGRTTNDPGLAQTRALAVRARLADAEADPAKLLDRMGQQSDPGKALREVGLFPVLERDLWRYAQARHPVALAGIYPGDALYEADYPLLLTPEAARDGELKALATRLADRMHDQEFASALTGRGLRPATGETAPTGDGLSATYQAPLDLPATAAGWAATWVQ
ncbi:hypothetical protein [Dactylosporangium salmoneum]|uniref:Uncharacterized protein n=1 Tax=Dactylosporangium salmoneum TaxID=53361 RepID=A0ABN3G855_9ACTN